MNALREFLQKNPWIGWAVALVAIAFAAAMILGVFEKPAPDSVERRGQQVTIRCTETGETWQMSRGEFERMLLLHKGKIDPGQGIPSKFAEGRLTGVLVDDDEWRETVKRINAMKAQFD
jgi:hypothetical protein